MRAGGINIFEGGRRIRDIILWLVGLVTAGLVLFGGNSAMVMEKSFPDEAWTFSKRDCDYSDHAEYLETFDLSNLGSRYITLCFRKQQTGFAYEQLAAGEMAPPLVRTVTPSSASSNSDPAPDMKWYNFNDERAPAVQNYFKESSANFTVNDANLAIAGAGLWRIRFSDFKNRVEDSGVPGVVVLIALWIITAALGWVVRGFAGVPVGQDFRQPTQ